MDNSKLSQPETAPLLGRENDEEAIRSIEAGKPAVEKKDFREIVFVCIGLATVVFCSALSTTIVSNLQIEIASYFQKASLAAWIGSAYLLGLAAMTPLWGRLCEMFGRRTSMIQAINLFMVGTVLCSIAPNMNFLIFARIISGCGGGGLLTLTSIIITDLVSLDQRGLYQGFINVLYGLGSAIGAVIGGIVDDFVGWRWTFALQIPFLFVSLILVLWKVHIPLPKSEFTTWQKFKRVDWAGIFALVSSISCFMLAASLVTSSHYLWSHPAVISLSITALVTLIAFPIAEKRALEPILPLEILTQRSPGFALIGFLNLSATNFARAFYQPVYLHVVRGLNGGDTGIVLLPASITGPAGTLVAGSYMTWSGRYKTFTILNTIIPNIQALSTIFTWGSSTNLHQLWAEMAVAGLGAGAALTSLLTGLMANVESGQISMAISACYLFRAVGQVLGGAIGSAIQQAALLRALENRLGNDSSSLIQKIIEQPTTIIPALEESIKVQAKMGYQDSIDAVFWFIFIAGSLLTICSIGVAEKPIKAKAKR